MSKLIKKAIILVVVVIIIAVFWNIFSGKKADDASLTVVEGEGSAFALTDDSIVEDTFLGTLLNISTLSLNDSVFGDPRFASLQDFTVTLIPQSIGRTNPFLPTSTGVSPTTTTTTLTTPTAQTTTTTSTTTTSSTSSSLPQ
jgi:hypothetical protein